VQFFFYELLSYSSLGGTDNEEDLIVPRQLLYADFVKYHYFIYICKNLFLKYEKKAGDSS